MGHQFSRLPGAVITGSNFAPCPDPYQGAKACVLHECFYVNNFFCGKSCIPVPLAEQLVRNGEVGTQNGPLTLED